MTKWMSVQFQWKKNKSAYLDKAAFELLYYFLA